jgi:hypothetical protein
MVQWAVYVRDDAGAEWEVDSYHLSRSRAKYRSTELRRVYEQTRVVEVSDEVPDGETFHGEEVF